MAFPNYNGFLMIENDENSPDSVISDLSFLGINK